ncbi:MAG: threonine synthase [Solobacterium sp.]|nr:threonine synthase [Solobacterium sp.]
MPVYISTRNKENFVSAHEAVIRGLSQDGGLFVPESVDAVLDPSVLASGDYRTIAEAVISVFFDDLSKDDIHACVYGAYDTKFDTPEIVPLRRMSDGWLMDLWHGPTSAFKDLALTILPRFMSCAYDLDDCRDTISILTATSGDTGKAALSGFADVPHTAVTVFYPEDGVSEVQKLQMQTAAGNNVCVIAVKGNFDDCQRMVKEASVSETVRNAAKGVRVSSANSINIGRLVPQIVYYFSSYAKLVQQNAVKAGEPVNFVVPTGNFGDILAGYYARRIGLPVKHLICASNRNNVLSDFLETGTYDIRRPFYTTMSPSMDIIVSSNLERLLFEESGHDDALVRDLMRSLSENGSFTIPADMKNSISSLFKGYWCSEEDCAEEIRSLYEREHLLIDPHTAIALNGMHKHIRSTGDDTPCIVLSTASAFKFPQDVYRCLTGETCSDGFEAMQKLSSLTGEPVPPGLAQLKDLPVRFTESIRKEDGIERIRQRMEEIANG